jgi:hypothetical protein
MQETGDIYARDPASPEMEPNLVDMKWYMMWGAGVLYAIEWETNP